MGGEVPALEMLLVRRRRPLTSAGRSAAREVTRLMESFDFGEAGRQINEFFWSEYCDWYLRWRRRSCGDEATSERTAQILRATLDHAAAAASFMPFVTEEIWHPTPTLPKRGRWSR